MSGDRTTSQVSTEAPGGSPAEPDAGSRTARKHRKRDARREEIRATAARMFFERGYEATTTHDIGAALGLLKGSIYYYISSKQDLLYEIIAEYHEDTRAHFERIVASEATPTEKLRALIEADTAHTATNLTKSSLFYTEWRALPLERQEVILAERAKHEQAVLGWLRDGQREGTVRADIDPRVTTFAVFGMVNSVYRWFRDDGRLSAEQIGREFAELVLSGVLVGR